MLPSHAANGELSGKLPELAGIVEEMPFELKVDHNPLHFALSGAQVMWRLAARATSVFDERHNWLSI